MIRVKTRRPRGHQYASMLRLPAPPPALVRAAVRLLPAPAEAAALALAASRLLAAQDALADLDAVEGRVVALELTDAGRTLALVARGRWLWPADPARAEVRIRGPVEAFLALALRAEDPDTLFFQRRLVLEGDTETGLYLKNRLDALDWTPETMLRAALGARLGGLAAAAGAARLLRAAAAALAQGTGVPAAQVPARQP